MRVSILNSLFFLFWTLNAIGQNDKVLKKLGIIDLDSYKRDTIKIVKLNELAKKNLQINKPLIALNFANKALTLAQDLNWNKGLLLSYSSIANIQNVSNHHYEAIQTGLKGLALAEKISNKYYEVVFYRSLGNNYDMLDNYSKAMPYYLNCLKKSENFPEAARIRANCLVEIGDAYRLHLKNPLRAKELIEEAILIYQKVDTTGIGYAYDYLGQVLTELKEYDKAAKIFSLSRIELEKNKKFYLIPELLFHTAQLFLSQKKYDLAQKYALEGVRYSQKMGTIYSESEALKILYLLNKANNHPVEALQYFEKYTILRDSLTEVNMNYRFEQVQGEYKTQKQSIQINELKIREKNALIAKQKTTQYFLFVLLGFVGLVAFMIYINNRKLRQKNKEISEAMLKGQTIERQRVAADLHDNLGSTLSALWLSIDMIDKSKMNAEEREIHQNLRENLEKAYNDVRLLSHNLLPEEFEKQGLVPALQSFVRKISKNSKIAFDLQIAEDFGRVEHKIEFELYSICLELVNNIVKHSKATEAKIVLARTEKLISLTVSDNGIGTFNNESDGKGMKNVKARVESLNGVWNVKNAENQGTVNLISIPV